MYPTMPKRPLQPTRRPTDVQCASRGTARRQLSILTALALVVPLLLAGCTSPITSTSSLSYQPLPSEATVTPGNDYTTVLQTSFTVHGYDTRRVTDQVEVLLQPSINAEIDNRLICFEKDNPAHALETASTGTNYTGSILQWNVSMLLTQPTHATGDAIDICYIELQTGDRNSNYTMHVLQPPNGQSTSRPTTGTWLQVSSENEDGAQQWVPSGPSCTPNGRQGNCKYIGNTTKTELFGPNPNAIDVFSPPHDVWSAKDAATFIDAVGTFQITSCPYGTSSCPSGEWGDVGAADPPVVTYLEIDQFDWHMNVCQMHRAYTEQHPSGDTFDITTATHHQPLYFHVIAPVSQTCGGSRQFGIDLHIEWKGGNPIKIDGGNVNVINSVLATTTRVPLVIRHTEAQADAALQAAGLTASPVYIMAPDKPGTVLDQNAPAFTVEPTGSPVQITVSQGQTTVPRLLGDDLAEATRALSKVGLSVGTVSYLNNCVDPGTVQIQDPLPDAQAPLGSPVNLQISTCTSKPK